MYKENEESPSGPQHFAYNLKNENIKKNNEDYIAKYQEFITFYINQLYPDEDGNDNKSDQATAVLTIYPEFEKISKSQWLEYGLLDGLCAAMDPEMISYALFNLLDMIIDLLDTKIEASMAIFQPRFILALLKTLQIRELRLKTRVLEIISMMIDPDEFKPLTMQILIDSDFIDVLDSVINDTTIIVSPYQIEDQTKIVKEKPKPKSPYRRNPDMLEESEIKFSFFAIQTFAVFYKDLTEDLQRELIPLVQRIAHMLLKPNNDGDLIANIRISPSIYSSTSLEKFYKKYNVSKVIFQCLSIVTKIPTIGPDFVADGFVSYLVSAFRSYQNSRPLVELFINILEYGGLDQLDVGFYNILCSYILGASSEKKICPALDLVRKLSETQMDNLKNANIFQAIHSSILQVPYDKKIDIIYTLFYLYPLIDADIYEDIFSAEEYEGFASTIENYSDENIITIIKSLLHIISVSPKIYDTLKHSADFIEYLSDYLSDCENEEITQLIEELLSLLNHS